MTAPKDVELWEQYCFLLVLAYVLLYTFLGI